jgi:hypothetical protein
MEKQLVDVPRHVVVLLRFSTVSCNHTTWWSCFALVLRPVITPRGGPARYTLTLTPAPHLSMERRPVDVPRGGPASPDERGAEYPGVDLAV